MEITDGQRHREKNLKCTDIVPITASYLLGKVTEPTAESQCSSVNDCFTRFSKAT